MQDVSVGTSHWHAEDYVKGGLHRNTQKRDGDARRVSDVMSYQPMTDDTLED